ncbi:NUDIX hydrolase [Paenibacillus macquariensis]|uniref:ADP-ribose pyrophosphatase YjhB, NUDIX family n=1 Tax=Paenibacillus macquariensis TaxID=948756 RepID=A0ABY1KAS0_9BACL|nr:NUDIX domain-containing protein [Paenibacillus macquariensis]MEC0089462.1 NUDIX domain-containing protein [Paenibacillus macquariensis]OAB25856.1 NUDIX hydrolase [Paenibacillus macquariensis subsp. macquariensis]SIR52361.1 ADP-ribose pyrophosphatase YjhB, NUDIX family [Paenibacillus macquariensis]
MKKYTHLGVYGILIHDDQILLIKKSRGPHKGKWDLPGGTIEFGEEPYDTLMREFYEETGIVELDGKLRTAISYTLVYPLKENELEELHHIGIIYDVKLTSSQYILKTDGDGEDSLGASWIQMDKIDSIETTPFVRGVLS